MCNRFVHARCHCTTAPRYKKISTRLDSARQRTTWIDNMRRNARACGLENQTGCAYKCAPYRWGGTSAQRGIAMTEHNEHGQDCAYPRMTKAEAIAQLGGTQAEAAARIGVTPQAVQAWPEVLTDKLRDRVQAVLWREYAEGLARVQRTARRRAAALLQSPDGGGGHANS